MKKTKNIKVNREVVEDIICNKCGQSLLVLDEGIKDYSGLIEYEIIGGYCSPVFADCSKYTFSLCEKCLNELFKTFKIPAYQEE